MRFKVGDRVKHKIYGKGIIKYIDNDKTYAVEFDKDVYGINCRGYCKKNHGHWCEDNTLEIDMFTKNDLQDGDIVTYRDNHKAVIGTNKSRLCGVNESTMMYLADYDEDLNYTTGKHKKTINDIIKIERPIGYKTVYERKEEILDETEKRYLSNVIRPFKEEVCSIKKMKSAEQYRIKITTREGNIILPHFQKDKMYVNMQEEKEYKLEELGL